MQATKASFYIKSLTKKQRHVLTYQGHLSSPPDLSLFYQYCPLEVSRNATSPSQMLISQQLCPWSPSDICQTSTSLVTSPQSWALASLDLFLLGHSFRLLPRCFSAPSTSPLLHLQHLPVVLGPLVSQAHHPLPSAS